MPEAIDTDLQLYVDRVGNGVFVFRVELEADGVPLEGEEIHLTVTGNTPMPTSPTILHDETLVTDEGGGATSGNVELSEDIEWTASVVYGGRETTVKKKDNKNAIWGFAFLGVIVGATVFYNRPKKRGRR